MSDQQKITEFSQSTKQNESAKLDKTLEEFGWGSFGRPPEDWPISRVEDLFEIQKNSVDPEELDKEELVRLYSMPAFDDGKEPELTKAGDIGSKKFQVPTQTLLFSKLNISKKRFWLVNHSHDEPALCSTEYWPLLPENGLNLEFFLQYFKSDSFIDRPRLSTSSTKNSHQRIKSNLFNKVRLPVPPLSEQRKIATVLYMLDRAIEKTEEVKDQLFKIKRGTTRELLTSGFPSNSGTEINIGPNQYRYPSNWEVMPLSELIDIKSGEYFPAEDFRERGIRCLKIDNVHYGRIIWENETYLPERYLDEYSDLVLEEGDILLALNRPITNNQVKVGMMDDSDSPALLYQRVGELTPNEGIRNEFLLYALSEGPFKHQLERRLVGSDQPYINKSQLQNIKIPVPPLQVQDEIVEHISSIGANFTAEKANIERLNRLKHGLIQDLLSGTVRTTDTNIEVPDEIAQHG